MPTINQLVRRPRKQQRRRTKSLALQRCPFKAGIVQMTKLMDPKKPNSGHRHAARVLLTTGTEVTCFIPGEGHNIQQHSVVLVRGGRVQDVPGVRYKIVRGNRDTQGVQPSRKWANGGDPVKRNKSRSKYGVKRNQ